MLGTRLRSTGILAMALCEAKLCTLLLQSGDLCCHCRSGYSGFKPEMCLLAPTRLPRPVTAFSSQEIKDCKSLQHLAAHASHLRCQKTRDVEDVEGLALQGLDAVADEAAWHGKIVL